jgi:hypothetical protein
VSLTVTYYESKIKFEEADMLLLLVGYAKNQPSDFGSWG